MSRSLKDFLLDEGITLPTRSDIMLGMSVSQKHAEVISKTISIVFEGVFVVFSFFDNGCHKRITVESSEKLQFDNTVNENDPINIVLEFVIGSSDTSISITENNKPIIHKSIKGTGIISMRKMLIESREKYTLQK